MKKFSKKVFILNFGIPRIAKFTNYGTIQMIKYLSTFDDDFKKREEFTGMLKLKSLFKMLAFRHRKRAQLLQRSNECLADDVNNSDSNFAKTHTQNLFCIVQR